MRERKLAWRKLISDLTMIELVRTYKVLFVSKTSFETPCFNNLEKLKRKKERQVLTLVYLKLCLK